MAAEKTENQKFLENVGLPRKSGWNNYQGAKRKQVDEFSEEYMDFLGKAKTERECAELIVKSLKSSGFKPIEDFKTLKPGDKVYKYFRNKVVLASVIGSSPSFHLIGNHMDCPRLDLKPHPISEASNLSFLRTHYYGGIKKYQWVNVPLAMHGVVYTKSNKKIEFALGEDDKDPCFMVSDLLVHLAKKQLEKKAEDVIEGEQLSIIAGNIPVDDPSIEQKVKFMVLKHLYEKYGICEEDFSAAEIEFVPAVKPRDVGFDRSMIAAYGHDDRSCSFALLKSIQQVEKPAYTAVAGFFDKEEIGSIGDTSASSFVLRNFLEELSKKRGETQEFTQIIENSDSISADVTSGMNPNFTDEFDPENVSLLGNGVSVEKYGGQRGKAMSNDASAEYFQKIRQLLDKNKIAWQTGEISKVDVGGGGTIAMFLSNLGMNSIDAGPCVLGMHAPVELISKLDLYCAHLLYNAFFKE